MRESGACAARIVAVAVALATAACGARGGRRDPAAPAAASDGPARADAGAEGAALVGRDVAEVRVPLLGGEVLALGSLAGRPVLLVIAAEAAASADLGDAAAPGAGWLAAIDAQLVRWHGRLGPAALPAVHVSLAGDAEAVERAWRGRAGEWLQGHDPGGAVAARLGLARLPAVVLIGRDGRVAAAWIGAGPRWSDAQAAELDQRLEALAAAGP